MRDDEAEVHAEGTVSVGVGEPRGGPWSRVALVAVVALAMLLAWRLGVFARLSEPLALARAVGAMGVRGYVAFVVAYALLQPFGVPGTVFVVAAPLIWPWPVAFALSMVGTMLASVIGFSFARFVARDWVSARVPERFKKYDAALEQHAFRTVFLLRLIFWMPQALHAFLGVSRVPFWTHVWGSLAGYAPTLFVVSYFGAKVFDAHGNMKPDAWPIMGGMVAASLTVLLIVRVMERRQRG